MPISGFSDLELSLAKRVLCVEITSKLQLNSDPPSTRGGNDSPDVVIREF